MNAARRPTKPCVLVDQNCLHVAAYLNNRGYTASEAPPKTRNGTLQKYANENGLVVITRDGDWLEDWMTRNQRTGVIKLDGKSTIQKRGLANDAKCVLDNYGDELADGQLFEVIHAGPGQGPDVIRRGRPGEPVPPGPRSSGARGKDPGRG